ncbi:MAG: DUF1360 domain-containing protein [Bacillus sp. (in: firmicutes)]
MVESMFDLMVFSLACFRLTRLLVYDKITSFIRKPFFEEEKGEENGQQVTYIVPRKTGIRGWIGELLNCYWCTGIWMAIFIMTLGHFFPTCSSLFIMVLAIAGLASIIETIVQRFISE